MVRALVDLGLTSKEARAYLTLLWLAPATAAEIADAAGIARPKVYEALKSLEQRGFCYVRGDRVARYHAVGPDTAVPEWAQRREHERRISTQRDERLVGGLLKALPRGRDDDAIDDRYMHAKVGVDRTLEMLVDVVGRAESRLDIVVSTPVIQPRGQWNRSELRALERGVGIRVIYAAELVDDPERYGPVLDRGAEVRASSNLPLKMIVRDNGAEAVVSLVDTSDGELVATSVSVQHPELAAPFQLLFNRQWRQATEFAGTAPRRPPRRLALG
jgi:HTH-type transcriptional regulator, sugar sensing transcriptional regulator